ncbi:lipopolysaccharide assembly protein LapB [Pedobacter sp. L105]|uniref:tetratricopeptide repeat protein n=1 Tax=Pedobacter sp. L105 TaxID=1641871 RepID=UPI00131A9D2B|nr:tetratricopeptide repeat protein [Pedobacter sp. L105]
MIDKRRLFSLAFFIIVTAQSAFSQKTQLLIAKNSVGKLQAAIANKKDRKTQLAILGDGVKAVEAAAKDSKSRKWQETWAIKSYLSSYIAILDSNKDNSSKYYDLTLLAIDTAKRFNDYQDNAGLVAAANYNVNIIKQARGNEAYRKQDFGVAFKYLREVSDFFPKDTALAVNAGLCAEAMHKDDDVFTYFKRAKDNGIRNPAVFQRLANIYKDKPDVDKAIKTLQEGLAFNPYKETLNNDYINILLDNEKYTEANQVIESTLNVNTRSKLLYYLYGYLQQKNANMPTAEIAYNKALDADHNYFDALFQLGLVYINLGDTQLNPAAKDIPKFASYINRAEVILLQAHNVNTKDKATINLLIEIYTRKSRFDRVQELKAQLDEF